MAEVILEMKNISKNFGGTRALNRLDFFLERAEVHALLGENGAGKSTLIKVLGGVHQPDGGTIHINGREERITSVGIARQLGIGIIHQEIVLVPHLSITENIFLGRELLGPMRTRNLRAMDAAARKMLRRFNLSLDVRSKVADLSIAQQQLIEIIKAISFDVRILVMDEPTSSLEDEEVKKLFAVIRQLRSEGVSVIYISHKMDELFAISQRITVIRDGMHVGTRRTDAVTRDELVTMMVGRSLSNYYVRSFQAPGEEVFRVEGLGKTGQFEDISFSVRRGEILGFSGLVGSGRSEIMLSVFGDAGAERGRMFFRNRPVAFKNCQEAIGQNIAMVPENRKKQGLTLSNSVGFNISLANIRSYVRGGFIDKRAQARDIAKFIADLGIKTPSKDTAVSALSGGNQQKVVLAKWLATQPDLLILDEPTRGVDVGAKAEIYAIINRLAEEGKAIILISSELPEIINMCDRVCVVREGRIAAQLDRAELSQELIMQYATGGKSDGQ